MQKSQHCPEHRTAPCQIHQQCQGRGSTLGTHSLCGAVQWALRGPQFQPSSQTGSTESRGNVCPSSFQGVSASPWAQCLPWGWPSSRALHSSLLWDLEEIINSHVSGIVCFLASLFSLQGRKCYSFAHSLHLPSQNLFYMQGLEHWVRDQGKIKSHRAPPTTATFSSTLQQERPSQTRGIESRGRGHTKAVIRNASNPTNFTQACLQTHPGQAHS